MAGIMVMAAIPTGRRLISQVRVVDPKKWLMATGTASRIGALRRAPLGVRLVSRHHDVDRAHSKHQHQQHCGYVALVGVAAGMVALLCFYLCVWLVRHQRRHRSPAAPAPAPAAPLPLAPPDHPSAREEGDRLDEMKTTRPRGDDESATQTWSSESVELVVMAGEHVPTFVAHPVVQCPAQGNSNH